MSRTRPIFCSAFCAALAAGLAGAAGLSPALSAALPPLPAALPLPLPARAALPPGASRPRSGKAEETFKGMGYPVSEHAHGHGRACSIVYEYTGVGNTPRSCRMPLPKAPLRPRVSGEARSEEHTSELQSQSNL